MFVRMPVPMGVLMGMAVRMSTRMVMVLWLVRIAIGPAFRIEGDFGLGNFGAEALQHVRDDMVASDQDVIGKYLRGQMAVADLPGQRQQMARVAAAHFQQRFRFGDDLDHPPIVQHQPVAMT